MPTPESVAIREEKATERIRLAAVTLKTRTGADFSDVDLTVRMAPIERQAVTLEQLAAILESLVVVLQEPITLPTLRDEGAGGRRATPHAQEEAEELKAAPAGAASEEEAEDGYTDQSKRRPSPRRKT